MKTGRAFEERIKFQRDFPGVNCESCEEAFDEGDIIELPCEQCPFVLFGEPDRESLLTQRFIEYLNTTPATGMGHSPPWELLCAMAGITTLETLREVWVRLSIVQRVDEERRKLLEADSDASEAEED